MSCSKTTNCVDSFGCPSGICPDFVIKRYDTKPQFEITIEGCDGPLDMTDIVVEVSMWANAKLKNSINAEINYFSLADGIGFDQAAVGDIILFNRVRNPEQMLITGFDETNKYIQVQRAYNGTTAYAYPKGTEIKIFRTLNSVGSATMTLKDVEQLDGTVEEDVLTESKAVYEWSANDTCLPGCYWLEFKLLKMNNASGLGFSSLNIVPSFSDSPTLGCELGLGIEWARRFPVDAQGYLVKIIDSPTSELISA